MTRRNTIEITARAKAFTNEGVRSHRWYVDVDEGTVRVWDNVAGHYVRSRTLGKAAEQRILAIAVGEWLKKQITAKEPTP